MWRKGDGVRLGFGRENPAFLATLNPLLDSVSSFALGGLHSVALTSLGEVFTWSYSLYIFFVSFPIRIQLLLIELYTWGREEGNGRLGLGPGRGPIEGGGLSIPSKVKELPTPIAAASCGGFFTMALTKEGQLWNWGANSNYELGRGDKKIPVIVEEALADKHVVYIACGGSSSAAITGKTSYEFLVELRLEPEL
ncbi:hypothetical protein CRYUN_Cryun01aG0119500 [Craigia yunnanensis]